MEKNENKLGKTVPYSNEWYEFCNPCTGDILRVYEIKMDKIVDYGKGIKTKLMLARMGNLNQDLDTNPESEFVCFEIPFDMKKKEIYKAGILERCAQMGNFNNLNKKGCTYIGRICRLYRDEDCSVNYEIKETVPKVKEYIVDYLNDKASNYKAKQRKQYIKSNDVKINCYNKNSYTFTEPNKGKTVKVKDVVLASNIKYNNGDRTNLYIANTTYTDKRGKYVYAEKKFAFELPYSIGNVAKSENIKNIQKIRKLFAGKAEEIESKELTYIGALKETKNGFIEAVADNGVLGYVEELKNNPIFQ